MQRQAKEATSESLVSRQRIQQEATDCEQEAIVGKVRQTAGTANGSWSANEPRSIPSHVLEKLAAMEPTPADSLRLPKAEPDPEWERPIQRLADS